MDNELKTYLFRSVEVVNKNFILILILSLSSIQIMSKQTFDTFVLQFLFFIIVMPLIYGRFYEIITTKNNSSYYQIFNQHWLNYVLVFLILFSPTIIFGNISNGSGFPGVILKTLLNAILNIFGIYVFPLVFIKRERIFPIASGVKCLLVNSKYSLPLVLLTFLIFVFKALVQIFLVKSFQDSYMFYVTAALVQNIICNYITMVVFVSATMLLLNKSEFQKYLQSQT